MHKTENYQLPQWEMSDRIMMEDFNEAMGNIDQGLAKQDQEREELARELGSIGKNLRIETGSYKGTGTYGSSTPNEIHFQLTPMLVMVAQEAGMASPPMIMLYPARSTIFSAGTAGLSEVYVKWGDHSVSWYNRSSEVTQGNSSIYTYYYMVLGY